MRRLNRSRPVGPAQAYQTFQILVPDANWRPASCEEVGCGFFLNGWRLRVEVLPPQMLYTAKTAGRRFVEHRVADGETWLVFEAGQSCFKTTEHRVRLDMPELYVVRDGDWRGNPTGSVRRHKRAADWVDQFGEHQQNVAELLERG
jgi:hypothetical protein